MHTRFGSSAAAVALVCTLTAGAASAQTPEEIVEAAYERYQQRMANIENYTLVQETMGFSTTLYFEKRIVDGRPVFHLQSNIGASDDDISEMYNEFLNVAKYAVLTGKEDIDGHETYALYIDDFSKVDWGGSDDDDAAFTPEKGSFYLDTDEYILRKMLIEGEMETAGRTAPVTMESFFQDYRNVEGMLHPFRTLVRVSGFEGMMTEEDVENARRQLAEMKQRMEEMPESQRQMLEGMLNEQMQKLEEAASSGTMEFTLEVSELRVNEGPPSGP